MKSFITPMRGISGSATAVGSSAVFLSFYRSGTASFFASTYQKADSAVFWDILFTIRDALAILIPLALVALITWGIYNRVTGKRSGASRSAGQKSAKQKNGSRSLFAKGKKNRAGNVAATAGYGDAALVQPAVNPNPVGFAGQPLAPCAVGQIADEVPGETMVQLADRLRKYLHVCGVEIGERDGGRILASYAAYGSVRLAAYPGTEPALMVTVIGLLNAFFGERNPNDLVFAAADAATPEQRLTEVEVAWSGVKYGQPHCGIGADTFRGILREAEDEFFLPEEDWRAADQLIARCAGHLVPGMHNRMIRSMEILSSVLIATGTDKEEALDRALYGVLLPQLVINGGADALQKTAATFREVLERRDLPLCRRYLRLT